MFNKLSFRDHGADLIASSIYFSSVASRTMSEIIKKFPGYNDRTSANHAKALDHMLESLDPLISKAAIAHDVDKQAIVEKLRNLLSDGML